MKLTSENLRDLAELAITAAKEAGAIIRSYAEKGFSVISKDAGSSEASQVLTEADLSSQEKILEILSPTFLKFDLALLTEESEDDRSRFQKEYFWCIDPLDGTLPFTEGVPGYSVSIALVSREGSPVIGVIYDPVTDTLYSAITGCGAYRNGERWSIDVDNSEDLTLISDRSFTKDPRNSDAIKSFNIAKTVVQGGAAMNAMWVLENAPALYFKHPKEKPGGGSIWDYAASTLIFRELNVHTSDMYGDSLDLNRKDSTFMNRVGILYASTASVHKQILLKKVVI